MPKVRLVEAEETILCEDQDAKDGWCREVEVPEDKLRWIRRVFAELNAVQDYLEMVWDGDSTSGESGSNDGEDTP